MYNIILALHVLSAGLWVANLPVVLILNALSKRAANTSGEVHYMAAAGRIGLIMGNVGAIGILLTGPAMAGMSDGYGWFQFGEPGFNWLAWKQALWVLGLIWTGAVLIPRSKNLRTFIMQHMDPKRANTGASDDLRSAWSGYVMSVVVLNLIVLVNIFLGKIRP
jgi:hypothetical protein